MSGSPIEAVKQGIRTLHANLLGDPQACESSYMSVITFSSTAQQMAPLVEVQSFTPPDLHAGGTTALGGALRLLKESINTEVRKNTDEVKGDWRPLVFLLTDGVPTDDWQGEALALKQTKPAPNIIALSCGDNADAVQTLKQVSPTVLVMRDMTDDAFAKFFAFASQVSQQVSAKAGTPDAAGGLALTPPPGIIIINPD